MPDFAVIEKKWQQRWEKAKAFKAEERSKKPKFYCLEMFPYPSAAFLHMGHVRNYTIGDSIARFKRLSGFNVLYPMGYDSFGLPAENAAKKEGIHPKTYTENSIAKIMDYQKALGNSYDWDRVISTHEPRYYRWNQWFFLTFLKKGLVYRKKAPVNWCPTCKTVLANEEVVNGCCSRHEETAVETKELDQWFLKTTAYADELLDGLDTLQWSDRIKTLQRNWIGKSEGVLIDFPIVGTDKTLQVFTTRPDTIYGVTFVVVSPTHTLIDTLAKDKKAVAAFAKNTHTEKERAKEGIFLGTKVVNPFTGDHVPVFAANFVVAEYGTGAVMAVPAHDQRDHDFATKYLLSIKTVVRPHDQPTFKVTDKAYEGEGVLIDSGPFTNKHSEEAKRLVVEHAEKKKFGKPTTQYKLRDWLISRQRYWGTPIPIVYCAKCGAVPLTEKDLPLLLPEQADFTKEGNPLSHVTNWVNTKCPTCKGPAKRETDTMGGFVDSSWYFLRYCSPHEEKAAFDPKAVSYWMPVDQYIGGIEHAVGHLIYSRFWTKALRDLKLLSLSEPFTRLFNQGIVYKDGRKMSKSAGNIVTQTEISEKYGIDTARVFALSVASPESDMEWNDKGIDGVSRFILKFLTLFDQQHASHRTEKDAVIQHKLHQAIQHITTEMDAFHLDTAIQHLMDVVNHVHKWRDIISTPVFNDTIKTLCILCSPFLPHVAEECWEKIGGKGFVSVSTWPQADTRKINDYFDHAETLVAQTLTDIRDIMRLVRIEKCALVTLFLAEPWKHTYYTHVRERVGKTLNPGDLIKTLMQTELKKYGQDITKTVPKLVNEPGRVQSVKLDHAGEAKAFDENKKFIEKELGCTIEVVAAEKSTEPKARNAWPGKPAILVA